MPQYGTRYMVGQKLGDVKSSIVKCVIPIIQIHNWIKLTDQKGIPQKGKYDDIRMPRNVGLTEWLKEGSIEGS